MNSNMIDWHYFSPRFWFYRLWWWALGGEKVTVPHKEQIIVVDHNHPLWYDVGATRVEVLTDDPMWLYGPWLEEHVGKRNRDWHITMEVEEYYPGTPKIEIQFRKGKSEWANVATLMWA